MDLYLPPEFYAAQTVVEAHVERSNVASKSDIRDWLGAEASILHLTNASPVHRVVRSLPKRYSGSQLLVVEKENDPIWQVA